ncbi:MAG: GNAT family N-acetyltransferase [Spirochaetes bacterium]|nr:GNAT family N-acetyltransferase [Spirochaetota bacterium]
MQIRNMTKQDLPVILQITSKQGWISSLAELRIFIESNPLGCFVCVVDNNIIGVIMTFCHTKSSWIGNFIVAKEYRGKGIGKMLLSQALKFLDAKKKKQIYLNASCKAIKLYEKFGFKNIMPVNRWQGRATKPINANMEILPKSIPDILNIVKLDALLWRDQRLSLISRISRSRCSYFNFKPYGFLMFDDKDNIISIGPWELKSGDEDIAEKLLLSTLFNLESNSKIFLDVPSINKKAEKLLTKYNFKIIGSTMFMCRGRSPKIHFNEIYSFATMGSMG